jgi:hypothetical protein
MLRTGMESGQVDYHQVADLVWSGKTVPDAVRELGHDWCSVQKNMPATVKRYMLDISMLASVREDYLGASNDTD